MSTYIHLVCNYNYASSLAAFCNCSISKLFIWSSSYYALVFLVATQQLSEIGWVSHWGEALSGSYSYTGWLFFFFFCHPSLHTWLSCFKGPFPSIISHHPSACNSLGSCPSVSYVSLHFSPCPLSFFPQNQT